MNIIGRLAALAPRHRFLALSFGLLAILFLTHRLLAPELGRPEALQSQSGVDAPRPIPTIISSDTLPHVAGKKITTVLVEFPPGGYSPAHHHGGSVTVYVLSGRIESQLAGGPPGIYSPGETFFEPPGITHMFARNMSTTESAGVLAIFVHDDGATLTTYH